MGLWEQIRSQCIFKAAMRVAEDVAVYKVLTIGSQDFSRDDKIIIQKEASLI